MKCFADRMIYEYRYFCGLLLGLVNFALLVGPIFFVQVRSDSIFL